MSQNVHQKANTSKFSVMLDQDFVGVPIRKGVK